MVQGLHPIGVGPDGDFVVAGGVLAAADRFEGAILGVDRGFFGVLEVGTADAEAVVDSLELSALVVAVEKVGLGDDAAVDDVARGGGVGGGGRAEYDGTLEAHQQHAGDHGERACDTFLAQATRVERQLADGTR